MHIVVESKIELSCQVRAQRMQTLRSTRLREACEAALRCYCSALFSLWLLIYAAACAGPAPPPEIAALRRLAATGDEGPLAASLDASMVRIPAGEFVMGSDTGRPGTIPCAAHPGTIPSARRRGLRN